LVGKAAWDTGRALVKAVSAASSKSSSSSSN
jgi:hypothetical protein